MIIVEDGAGLPDANSFVSVEECDAYHLARANYDWANASPSEKEAALINATAFISTGYTFSGSKANGRTQALAWPRHNAFDRDGFAISDDTVPQEVREATCEAALFAVQNPGGLSASYVAGNDIESRTVGDVSTTFKDATARQIVRPFLSRLEDLLAGLGATRKGATKWIKRA